MTITDKLIPVNNYNRPGTASTPVRICVHYTGQAKTGADTLAAYYSNVASGMFKNSGQDAWTSTQYIVGIDGEIIRIIPDNEVAYAAAGKNNGTIHIEVCYPDVSGKFSDASISTLAELVPYLMNKYGISSDNVVRHYDLTGKLCPYYYIETSRWETLKNTITAAYTSADSKVYRVQVGAFSSYENAQNFLAEIKSKGLDGFVVS